MKNLNEGSISKNPRNKAMKDLRRPVGRTGQNHAFVASYYDKTPAKQATKQGREFAKKVHQTKSEPARRYKYGSVGSGKHGAGYSIIKNRDIRDRLERNKVDVKLKKLQANEEFIGILEGFVKAANKAKKNKLNLKRPTAEFGHDLPFRLKNKQAKKLRFGSETYIIGKHNANPYVKDATDSPKLRKALYNNKLKAKHMKNESFIDMLEGYVKAANKAKKKRVPGLSSADRIRSGSGRKNGNHLKYTQKRSIAKRSNPEILSYIRNAGFNAQAVSPGKTGGREEKPLQHELKRKLKAKHMKNESFMGILEGLVKAANKAKKNAAFGASLSNTNADNKINVQINRHFSKYSNPGDRQRADATKKENDHFTKKYGKSPRKLNKRSNGENVRIVTPGKHGNTDVGGTRSYKG